MKKYTLFIIALVITTVVLSSCLVPAAGPVPTTPPEQTDLSGQFETLQAQVTEQAATIESQKTAIPEVPVYSGDFAVISSSGLTFDLPAEVAAGASVSIVPQDDPEMGWPDFELPERRLVSFSGYVIQNHFHKPAIHVIPLEQTYQIGKYGATMATKLQTLLDNPDVDLASEDNLPFLPPFNAAQVFHALEKRLESDKGRGIRYLTLYSQGIVGIDNFDIFYTYQGISSDGKYYIAAVLPINSSLLQDLALDQAGLEAMAEKYPEYIANMTELLRSEGGGVLTPSLEALDNMMMSLEILSD